ncbi:hypothetical protein BDC45DRAFT_503252 [Circinella umbellata]|nr:hypothetical protein BDC45DRAFT_503252 [Circinella umbellata]
MTLSATGMDVCIIEVSGPPQVKGYTHFVNDRRNLVVNMKKAFRYIIYKNKSATKNLLQRVTIYGLHFYDAAMGCLCIPTRKRVADARGTNNSENGYFPYGQSIVAIEVQTYSKRCNNHKLP